MHVICEKWYDLSIQLLPLKRGAFLVYLVPVLDFQLYYIDFYLLWTAFLRIWHLKLELILTQHTVINHALTVQWCWATSQSEAPLDACLGPYISTYRVGHGPHCISWEDCTQRDGAHWSAGVLHRLESLSTVNCCMSDYWIHIISSKPSRKR